MKIKELFEDSSKSNSEMAWGALHDEADEIKSFLEEVTDFEFNISKKNSYLILSTGQAIPEITLKFDIETRLGNQPKDFVQMTLILDVDKASISLVDALRRYFKSEHNRSAGMLERPWYFDDYSRYTADGITILQMNPEQKAKPVPAASSQPKYDPQQAYYDRMTPAAKSRQRAISNHQFSNSIGGDSSNYRSSNYR